jgi:toxin-antitoxin system PIN domain toxin
MSLQLFPDVNVWVALNFERHAHHESAKGWYEEIQVSSTIVFCRQTQLGMFRILSTATVMREEILTQRQCWGVYDRWISTGQVAWAVEPQSMEAAMRTMTAGTASSPKAWMDAYLAAFAEAGRLTLVTFDRALAGKVKGAVLLG